MTAPTIIGLVSNGLGQWALAHRDEAYQAVIYTRADLARPTLTQALALPEVKALVEALEAKTVMDPNNSNSTWLDAQARTALAALTTATADGGKP